MYVSVCVRVRTHHDGDVSGLQQPRDERESDRLVHVCVPSPSSVPDDHSHALSLALFDARCGRVRTSKELDLSLANLCVYICCVHMWCVCVCVCTYVVCVCVCVCVCEREREREGVCVSMKVKLRLTNLQGPLG